MRRHRSVHPGVRSRLLPWRGPWSLAVAREVLGVVARWLLARPHDARVEGHPRDGVAERLRHEGENRGVVVAEVVTPAERVVDASPIEAGDVALEVPDGAAEEIDLLLALAAVLAGQQTAGWDPGGVEPPRVGAHGGQKLVVEPDRVEVVNRLVARHLRRLVDLVRER